MLQVQSLNSSAEVFLKRLWINQRHQVRPSAVQCVNLIHILGDKFAAEKLLKQLRTGRFILHRIITEHF